MSINYAVHFLKYLRYLQRWNETAYEPAVKVFEALLEGATPPQDPLPLSPEALFGFEETRKVFRCDVCGKVMKGSIQYEAHMNSRLEILCADV